MIDFTDCRIIPGRAYNGANGNKITSCENPDCNEALARIVPRIDVQKISSFIQDVPAISDLHKSFYTEYLNARYRCILKPAFDICQA